MNDTEYRPVRGRDLLKENIRQALDVIRLHRMRSILLIMGVAIGITTILAMVTILSGLGRKINKDLVSASRPYLIVQKFDFFVGGENREKLLKRRDIEAEDREVLEESCESLDVVSYSISPDKAFILRRESRKTQPLQVLGATPSVSSIYSLKLGKGRFYTKMDEDRRKRFVVLGYGPAKDLFPAGDPIGRFIRIENKRYKVIGTFDKRKHFLGSMSDNFAIIPSTTYTKDFKGRFDNASITANVKEGRTLEQGESEIINAMRAKRGLRAGEENDFSVITSEAFLDMINKVTFYIGFVLIVIASIGLVVGGIGVMNIMLISVAERTREIGLRMAVGAQGKDILQQVLVESAMLTGIGGAVGTLLGIGVAVLISFLLHFPFFFSLPWMVISVVFSGLVGIVFGIYPARRASGMDPVEALRYE